jgi:hypothetical protein
MEPTLPAIARAAQRSSLPGESAAFGTCRAALSGWQHVRTMTDARSPMRALRAAVFAAVCVTLAALGHSYTSGHEIPFGALVTAFGTTACGAWFAAGRRRGFPSLGAGLLTVQGSLHLIFAGALPYGLSTVSHDRHAMPGTGAGSGAGTGFGGLGTGLGMGAGSGMDMGAGAEAESVALTAVTEGPAAMVAAHLLAAAVCALWLARGEAALFQLAQTLGALALTPLRLLLAPARLPVVPRPAPAAPGAPAPHRFCGVVLAHSLSRRGPPVLRTASAPPGKLCPVASSSTHARRVVGLDRVRPVHGRSSALRSHAPDAASPALRVDGGMYRTGPGTTDPGAALTLTV